MQQLNQRQQKIIDFISKNNFVSNSEIIAFLKNEVSRFTVLRDLDLLLKEGLIKKEGKGRAVSYSLLSNSIINSFFDPKLYFEKGPDERNITLTLNADILDSLSQLFSEKEIDDLKEINNKYLGRIKKIDKTFFKKETERMTIELSWKSSKIEGNTYSLIDTEMLIKERVEAEGHKKEETIMILNHKNAIDYILNNKDKFKKLDLFQIEKVHELLTRGMGVKEGIRSGLVRITGTRYGPIKGRAEIIGFLRSTIDKINSLKDSFSKALALILMISYIQPFEDGNKRTARILGNAILLANNTCPLSYRSVNEADYKKAIVLFYEQNSARFFKELFTEQFKFAVENYF
ncbi:MAG: Fic family protein [Candidatus Parcubacteria bacterium]|nr:Fic family protein [Candidatus Parcubacteria bacterium]